MTVSDTIDSLDYDNSSMNADNLCVKVDGPVTINTSEIERVIKCQQLVSGRYVQFLNSPYIKYNFHLHEVEIYGFWNCFVTCFTHSRKEINLYIAILIETVSYHDSRGFTMDVQTNSCLTFFSYFVSTKWEQLQWYFPTIIYTSILNLTCLNLLS